MAAHEKAMARYFDRGQQQRFRVKPTVFMPTLPPLFDLEMLDRHARGSVRRGRRVHGPRPARATCREDGGLRLTTAGGRAARKPLDWAPFVWRTPTARSGWTSGASSEPSERPNRVPSLVKKRRKKMRKKKHKKLLKRTRHQRMKLGK